MKLLIIKIKVAILFIVAGISILVFAFGNRFSEPAHASISGPPTARTGAPGESTCTSCHTPNAQSGQFSIVAPSNYVPGQTYQIQVKHVTTDTSRQAWGFELISLAGAAMAGSFPTPPATTRVRASGTKSYIEQSSSGTFPNQTGGATWTFNWTAPANDVGAVTFYAAGLQCDNDGNEDGDQTYTTSVTIQPGATTVINHHVFSDFDGDGKADISVFRATDSNWYVNRSATNQLNSTPFGMSTDTLTPADFDGDDKADIAVWRSGEPLVAGFYILQSSNNTVRFEQFGQTGDVPFEVGDWDGDGKADPAVYRDAAFGSQSYFFYRGSLNNPSGIVNFVPWGTSGDKPMRGDFDGDGKIDAAVFRPSTGVWYILRSSDNAFVIDRWGLSTDKFVLADYDGDAKTDLAVFRNGVWYIKQSSNNTAVFYNWGLSTDLPVTGDFDSDGKADVGIFRAGNWYLRMSGTSALSSQSFGNSTDKPIPNVFVQ